MKKGTLYLCATPIGNLDDITYRLVKVLKEVDLIACEDTRRSVKLINYLEIEKPLTSYHEHNKMHKGPKLIEELESGKNIALVSDAGMPAISDPGEELVQMCIDRGIKIECIGGPVALIHALVKSGLSTRRFFFEGFLDRNKKERVKRLEEIKYIDGTIIVYEAPHRLKNSLEDMKTVLGDRDVVVARELTKKFEEFVRGDFDQVIKHFKENDIKGEFVVLISGSTEKKPSEYNPLDDLSIEEELKKLIDEGMSKKDASKEVAIRRELPKKDVYKISIDM